MKIQVVKSEIPMNQWNISIFLLLNPLSVFNHGDHFLSFDQDYFINSLGNVSSSMGETPKSFFLIENIK